MLYGQINLRETFCKNRASYWRRRHSFGQLFLKNLKFYQNVGHVETWKKFTSRKPLNAGYPELQRFEVFLSFWQKFFFWVGYYATSNMSFDGEFYGEFNGIYRVAKSPTYHKNFQEKLFSKKFFSSFFLIKKIFQSFRYFFISFFESSKP